MSPTYLEHANVTVRDLDAAVAFLLAALPDWQVRGGGSMAWHGKTIDWVHVGTDTHYLAPQGGGEGVPPAPYGHAAGVKHLGFVVPDLDAVLRRLAEAGYRPDPAGGTFAGRRSAYFSPDALLQLEFVEYLVEAATRRNVYEPSAASAVVP